MFTVFSTFPEMALAATKIHKASKAQRGSCRDGPVSEGLATQHKDLCLDSKNPSKTERGGMGL